MFYDVTGGRQRLLDLGKPLSIENINMPRVIAKDYNWSGTVYMIDYEKDILTYKSKHGKVENIFDVLFRGTNKENKLLKYHNLNDLTPRRAQNIINKNLIFINNINSLYASNKILAELNAL